MEQYLFGFCAVMDENDSVNAVEKGKDELIAKEKSKSRDAAANEDGLPGLSHAGLLNACAVLLIVFGMYKTAMGFRQLPTDYYLLGVINILGTLLIWYGVYGLISRERWSIGLVLCIGIAGAVTLAAELAAGWLLLSLHLLFISLLILSLLVLTIFSKKYCA